MKHISFDVWGTLLKSNPDNNIRRAIYVKEHFNIDLEVKEIERLIKENGKEVNELQELNGIQLTRNEIFSRLFNKLNIKSTQEDCQLVDSIFQKYFLEHPPVIYNSDYITALNNINTNYTISILSNTVYIIGHNIQIILDHYFGSNFFKFKLYSDEMGFAKPSEVVYKELIKMSNTQSDQILHIGDSFLCDVVSPLKYGIDTFQVHSNGKTINDLMYGVK